MTPTLPPIPVAQRVSRFSYAIRNIVVEAKRATDTAQRAELYAKAQEIFKDQVPWLTLSHSVQTVVLRPEVVDYAMSPFGLHNFYGVDLR